MSRRPVAKIEAHLPGRGTHTVTAAAMDVTIAKYLPDSPFHLRQVVADRLACEPEDLFELGISELLVMLADFDHNTSDSPLAVGR